MHMIIHYIISSFLFSLLAVPFVLLLRFRYYKKGCDLKREIALLLFFMCAVMIFCQTAIPPQFIRGNFTLSAFHAPDVRVYRNFPKTQLTWIQWMIENRHYGELVVNLIGNVIIFLPIGFLAPFAWEKLVARAILIGFCLSCLVEFIQLFTDRSSDYNDIILNTLGTLFGYLLYLILKHIFHKKKSVSN